ASLVMDAFTAYPELNGVYVHGGGCTGAVEGLRSIGRLVLHGDPDHVYVVTNDCDSLLAKLLDDGLIDGFGSHGSWDLVDTATKLMFTYVILGEPVAPNVFIPITVVTADNIGTARQLGGPAGYPWWMPADYDLWPVLDAWNYPIYDLEYNLIQVKTPTKA
ncbi:unnamed protein product, partial [marine sediment metagenome]